MTAPTSSLDTLFPVQKDWDEKARPLGPNRADPGEVTAYQAHRRQRLQERALQRRPGPLCRAAKPQQRSDVVYWHNAGNSTPMLSVACRIPYSTARRWIRRHEAVKLSGRPDTGFRDNRRFAGRPRLLAANLLAQVATYIRQKRAQSIEVTPHDVRNKFMRLLAAPDSPLSAQAKQDFRASTTFMRAFFETFALTARRSHNAVKVGADGCITVNKALSIRMPPKQAALSFMASATQIIKLLRIEDRCIFNLDETHSYCETHARRVLETVGNKLAPVRSHSKEGDGFTVLNAYTAAGDKLPLWFVMRQTNKVKPHPNPSREGSVRSSVARCDRVLARRSLICPLAVCGAGGGRGRGGPGQGALAWP